MIIRHSSTRFHHFFTNLISLGFCLLFMLGCLESQNVFAEHNRYNVLFIAVDDLRPELGCYGSRMAISPHLDRFADSATLFQKHYVQVATCGASRYALLTGRSPANSGVTRSNSAAYSGKSAFLSTLQPGAQTLPELFRRSGYQTCCIGKISHTADGRVYAYNGTGDGRDELPHAWEELATPFGSWERGWGIFFAYANGRHRESGRGDKDLMEFIVEQDDELPDGLLADKACLKLEDYQKSGQPFFLGLGFFKPHLPFVAPRQDWEAVSDLEFGSSDQQKIDSPFWHRSGEFYKYDAPFEKTNPLGNTGYQLSRRAYAACVRYVDRQIGQVLQQLQTQGLAENTIVVIWGDHGWHLGEQQIWAKHTPFERANRSALMIRVPGASVAGLQSEALVETIDLYPTLLDYCHPKFQQTTHPLDGRSLRPILEGTSETHHSAAISYWGKAISIRDERYRLILPDSQKPISEQKIELYDLKDSPDSVINIAAEHPEIVSRLQSSLKHRK